MPEPMVHNYTEFSIVAIKEMPLVGIVHNKFQGRMIRLHTDPVNPETHVLTIGTFQDGMTIVVSRESLRENMNFRIALDYWAHGKKVYVRE